MKRQKETRQTASLTNGTPPGIRRRAAGRSRPRGELVRPRPEAGAQGSQEKQSSLSEFWKEVAKPTPGFCVCCQPSWLMHWGSHHQKAPREHRSHENRKPISWHLTALQNKQNVPRNHLSSYVYFYLLDNLILVLFCLFKYLSVLGGQDPGVQRDAALVITQEDAGHSGPPDTSPLLPGLVCWGRRHRSPQQTTATYSLIVLRARNAKSRCGRGCAPSETCGAREPSCLFQLLLAVGSPCRSWASGWITQISPFIVAIPAVSLSSHSRLLKRTD